MNHLPFFAHFPTLAVQPSTNLLTHHHPPTHPPTYHHPPTYSPSSTNSSTHLLTIIHQPIHPPTHHHPPIHPPNRPLIVLLLMSMISETQSFKLRCSILYCFQSFLYKNELGQSQIVQTLLPSTSEGLCFSAEVYSSFSFCF